MPGAFICHIPAYLIGEMWIGVLIAIVVDLVPVDLTTSSIAVYVFIIQIIGGNMNLLVTPISNKLGLRFALLITFPGFYILAAVIFIIPLILLRREEAKVRITEEMKAANDMIVNTFKNSNHDSSTQIVQQQSNIELDALTSAIDFAPDNRQPKERLDLKDEKLAIKDVK